MRKSNGPAPLTLTSMRGLFVCIVNGTATAAGADPSIAAKYAGEAVELAAGIDDVAVP
jgi:hypothetical protein